MNRASTERPGAATSLSLRVTIERRLSNSDLLGGVWVTRLSATSFFQRMGIAQHKELRRAQHLRKKVILARPLPFEFRRGVDRRIDFTAKPFSGTTQWQCKVCRQNAAD